MSGQSAVGFSFQADIVNTANLGHLLTGRVLKALSDGGVDFYAVVASIHLGKFIPVRNSLESTVRTHLASRRSYSSVLNKILSIGWGHSEVAIEMSRTQAGTNALLLIGALANGHPSTFLAAQYLSELLSLNGFEADKIPNVDVLRGLVDYLAPFTFDLGFSKVLGHITTVAERAMRSRGCKAKRDDLPPQLSELGSAPIFAGAITQLIQTAERGETMYMMLKKHGSWLPAFASHILGMEVELRYSKNGDSEEDDEDDPVIWACAGDQGSVIFELGSSDRGQLSLYRSTGSKIEIVESECHGELVVDHLLQDALAEQLSRRPEIDGDLAEGIGKAIARLSWHMLQDTRMCHTPGGGHRIKGQFDSLAALKETLGSMGISQPSLRIMGLPFEESKLGKCEQTYISFETYAATYLDPKDHQSISSRCPEPSLGKCICVFVSQLINNFASSAVALMQCRFNAAQLRVSGRTLTASVPSTWVRYCAGVAPEPTTYIDETASFNLLDHLHHLLFGCGLPEASKKDGNFIGFSSGAYTVFYTAIMQHEAYDAYGRMISITSGRASVNGCLRNFIFEPRPPTPHMEEEVSQPRPFTLAVGSFVEPHCAPSDFKTSLHLTVTEHEIVVHLSVGCGGSECLQVSLIASIFDFLKHWRMPKCPHDRKTPFRVKKGMKMTLMGFHCKEPNVQDRSGVAIIALHGNKLHQILACGIYDYLHPSDLNILQIEACLKCCIEHAEGKGSSCIIMGG